MSIKQLDFQIMIPRTMEVSKTGIDENNRSQTLFQQQLATTQQHAENSVRQVHSQDKAQNARINQKQKENREKEQKKKGKNNNFDNKNMKNDLQTSTIDIKI